MRTLYVMVAASIAFASPAMACCGGEKLGSAKADGKAMCMMGDMKAMDHSKMGDAKVEAPKNDPHAGMDMGGDAPKTPAASGDVKKAGCGCCSGTPS